MWELDLGSGKGSNGGPIAQGLGRVVASFVFAVFLVVGGFLTVQIAGEAWQRIDTHRWSESAATIVRSEVVQRSGERPYVPTVAFQYVWNGESRTGTGIAPGDAAESAYADAAARIAPYPVGAVVPCRVAPDGRAVLEAGSLWMALAVLFPLVFVLVGAGGLYAMWKPKRRDAMGRTVEAPISSEAKGQKGARAMTMFGAVFALIGLGVLWPTGIGPARAIWQAQDWAPEECVVERSDVRSHRSDDGTTYSVDILYRWERGGQVARSNRYSFFGGSSSGREGKAEIVRAHPPGHTFTCWVDPQNPGQAVIERGLTAHAFVALVPLLFIGVGLFVMRLAARRRHRRSRGLEALRTLGQGPAPDDPVTEWLPEFELTPGPSRLAPESTRVGRLFGIVFAFCFWNGIVSVFAHQAVESFERGRPDWGLTLFGVPFVLVGIGLGVAIVFEILRATNARAELRANATALPLGDTLEIEWALQGRTSKLRRLTITLEGREQATYRRGTNSHTAMETFAKIPLASLVDPHRMRAGHAAITLPRDTMHSFAGGDNVLTWAICMKGEIERWPDIDERFPIVLLPLPPGQRSKPDAAAAEADA